MRKGKGFTLIELLAVIVILAIIALITVPIIINVIYKAEKGAFEDSAYGVLDAGRLYYADKLADTNSFAGQTFTFPNDIKDLKLSGEKPGGGTLVLDGEGRSTLEIYDAKKRWCALKKEEDAKITIADFKDGECKETSGGTPTQPPSTGAGDVIVDKGIVNTGEGLYDNPDNIGGGYVYKGSDPKNQVFFDNKCWSIISVSDNKDVKMIYEGEASNNNCTGVRTSSSGAFEGRLWSGAYITNWYHPTSIRVAMESLASGNAHGGKKIGSLSKVKVHTWYVGAIVNKSAANFALHISEEKQGRGNRNDLPVLPYNGKYEYVWESKVGLINGSDYIKASANSACTSYATCASMSNSPCKTGNYLFKLDYNYWTLNVDGDSDRSAYFVAGSGWGVVAGSLVSQNTDLNWFSVRPVIVFGNNTQITEGEGTAEKPYIVK